MKLKQLIWILAIMPLSIFATPVAKDNIVTFEIAVEKEVLHDLLQATLFVQAEDKELTLVNKKVNTKINQALEILKNYPDVEIRDNLRNTQIRYNDDKKQNGWIGRGQLFLQSKNNESLSKAINALDGILAIEYTNSQVSSNTLTHIEDEMMQQAFHQLEHKAKFIQQSLGANNYKIVELTIRTPNENGHFIARPYAAMARANTEDSVQLEGGKTNVRASIEAKIQLIQE